MHIRRRIIAIFCFMLMLFNQYHLECSAGSKHQSSYETALSKIYKGMTTAEVVNAIGEPSKLSPYGRMCLIYSFDGNEDLYFWFDNNNQNSEELFLSEITTIYGIDILGDGLSRAELANVATVLYSRITQRFEFDVPEHGPFDDIADSSYKKQINYAYFLGLMNGVGEGLFLPDRKASRCEIIVVLYRVIDCTKKQQGLSVNEQEIIISDYYYIPEWAREEVKKMTPKYNLLDNKNAFNPNKSMDNFTLYKIILEILNGDAGNTEDGSVSCGVTEGRQGTVLCLVN